MTPATLPRPDFNIHRDIPQTNTAASRNLVLPIEMIQFRWNTPPLRSVKRGRGPLQANETPKADRVCQLPALRCRAASLEVARNSAGLQSQYKSASLTSRRPYDGYSCYCESAMVHA